MKELIFGQKPPVAPRQDSSIFSSREWQSIVRWLKLSPREGQVVKGVFDNSKEDKIAGDLGISQHTVHTYLERLYNKLTVGGRTPLLIRVMDAHLRSGTYFRPHKRKQL